MRILGDRVHLTYCSNIHPGESWEDTRANVNEKVTAVKALISPSNPFGVGLRLSAQAADELVSSPGALDAFRAQLDSKGLYVFTLNGFPYGPFHGVPVKEAVYRPDWRDPERLRYTEVLIEILAKLLPAGVEGSISTVPGGFRRDIDNPDAQAQISEQLVECAAKLWKRRAAGGPSITLALEPEPQCMLENTSDALEFFTQRVFSRGARRHMAKLTGLGEQEAELALRQHIGICLDACHAAVEFEDPHKLLTLIESAGIRIAKMQVTTGLSVSPVTPEAIEALRDFVDEVYLHQVVKKRPGGLRRYLDLPAALAAHDSDAPVDEEWRVHYHVPVFQSELPPFRNTDDFLRVLLAEVLKRNLCTHLEVETYTWSVLPEAYRAEGLTEAIARELRWVLDESGQSDTGATP